MLAFRVVFAQIVILVLVFGLWGGLAAQEQKEVASPLLTDESGSVDARWKFLEFAVPACPPEHPIWAGRFSPSQRSRVGADAFLEWDRPLTPKQRGKLARLGIDCRSCDQPRRIVAAFVPFTAVDTLLRMPGFRRLEAVWHPIVLRPSEKTGQDIGAVQLRSRWVENVPGDRLFLDGSGVSVATIDSGVDVLHPHFFRADGGSFLWFDVDGDRAFTPGTDAVDFDRDGEVDMNETLRVLDATTLQIDPTTGAVQSLVNQDGELNPTRDWLYADLNGDGQRNRGVEEGFTEEDPGYGEPLFVVDDVDRNGFLEPPERLVLLGTSKIVLFDDGWNVYRRGENLIEMPTSSPVAAESMHGTGVASIYVGGQAGYHDRVGMAPGADLSVFYVGAYTGQGQGEQLYALEQAINAGANSILHEWTSPFAVPHDGSTVFEAAMDEASSQGVMQITPVGNLNLSEKHTEVSVQAGAVEELPISVGSGFGSQPFSNVFLSLFWTRSAPPTIQLISPNGDVVDLPFSSSEERAIGNDRLSASYALTKRGTHHMFITIWNAQNLSLAQGVWKIRLADTTADDVFVGRVSDLYSNWSRGVHWTHPTRDQGTISFPSTADSAFGVGAFGGRETLPDGSLAGELRGYSGRGPRIDGAQVVDIVAPDDPYAALASTGAAVASGWGRTWFLPFGGTSGAGPHVAGALALLMQYAPQWDVNELATALTEASRRNALQPTFGGVPNAHWGWGKLDVYSVLFTGSFPPANRRPVAVLAGVLDGQVVRFDASGSIDPDGDPLLFRFDLGYDGIWDGGWTEEPTLDVSLEAFDSTRTPSARLEVRDKWGARHGVLAFVALQPMEPLGSDAGLSDMALPDGGVGGREDAAGSDWGFGDALTTENPMRSATLVGGSSCGCGLSRPLRTEAWAFWVCALLLLIGTRRSRPFRFSERS